MTKNNILVVEDDQILASTIKNKLEKESFQVFWAKDGQEGLNIIGKNHIDLILLDILMPNMDGISMVAHLKKNIKETTPIIILTNVTTFAYQEEVTEALIKSNTSLSEIVDKVKKYLPTTPAATPASAS